MARVPVVEIVFTIQKAQEDCLSRTGGKKIGATAEVNHFRTRTLIEFIEKKKKKTKLNCIYKVKKKQISLDE